MNPLLSVVVPTSRDPATLPKVLGALARSDLPRKFWELVIVNDGTTDATVAAAAPFADTIVRIAGRPHGPAYARNRGVEVARGEIVVFVDADLVVRPDTLRRFAWAFLQSPDVAAVYGAYATDGESRGLISQYRDLLNHHLHHHGRGQGDGFWVDCGAVRREALLAVGMFNEWLFTRPQIEALELGQRLRGQGYRIEYHGEIQGTHLKRWTLFGMIAADLKDRGVPRSRLSAEVHNATDRRLPGDQEPLLGGLTWLGLIASVSGAVIGRPWLLAFGILNLLLVLLLDLPVFALFKRQRGIATAVLVAPLHVLHHLLGGIALVLGTVLRHSVGDPQPSATVQAFSEVGVVKWPPVPRQPDRSASSGTTPPGGVDRTTPP